MYYQIFVDGESIGVFGHDDVERMHLSFGPGKDGCYVFASAICNENGKQIHYDWIQKEVGSDQRVEIAPTDDSNGVLEPRGRFIMGRPEREPSHERVCDFCQRTETELRPVVHIDEHRPSICSDCVELCQLLLDK